MMDYITSLAKFGCSMVRARRQGQWKGKNFVISFLEEAAKVTRCFTLYFGRDFLSPLPRILQKFPLFLTLELLQPPVLLCALGMHTCLFCSLLLLLSPDNNILHS